MLIVKLSSNPEKGSKFKIKKILKNFFLTTFHLLSCQDSSIFLVYMYSMTFFVANVSDALAFIVHAKDIPVIIIGNKNLNDI